MSKLLPKAILLLSLISHGIDLATAWDDQDFSKYCPRSQCNQHGPEIMYPFCLQSSNTSPPSFQKLVCSGHDTILVHQVLGPYNVSATDYARSSMKFIPLVDPCLVLQEKINVSGGTLSPKVADPNDAHLVFWSASVVCCSREFTPGAADAITGPISCLSNTTHFFYFVVSDEELSLILLDCKVIPVSDGGGGRRIPLYKYHGGGGGGILLYRDTQSFKESAESILSFAEQTVYWDDCELCELRGGRCEANEPFCMRDPHGMINSNFLETYIIMSSCFICNKVLNSIKTK